MSELLDSNGQPINDLQFNLKKQSANHLADRKALHNKQGYTKPFESMEELEKQANSIYAKAGDDNKEEYEKDKLNGLDINDMSSVMAFEPDYTPLGDTLLVKYIKEDNQIGTIILPDSFNKDKKAVVIVPGLLVTTLFKGDIIIMKGSDRNNPYPPSYKRRIKDIDFEEIPSMAVSGVYKSREALLARIREEDKKNGH